MRPMYPCNVAAGTVWATSRTNEYMRHRQLEPSQSFTAGMPAKLNSNQLPAHAGDKDWDDQCWRPLLFGIGTVSQAVPAAMSQVHRRHMRTRLKTSIQKYEIAQNCPSFSSLLLPFPTMIAFHRVKKSPLIIGIVDRIKINSESELIHTFCKLHVSTYFTSVSFISRSLRYG